MSPECEVVFRFPSKAVQYGYVEIRQTTTDEITAEILGRRYARAVWEFWQAEDSEIEVMRKEAQKVVQEGLGASVVAEEKGSDACIHPKGFTWAEDDAGHSGSVCGDCGASELEPELKTEKPWERKPKAAKAKPWEDKKGTDPKSAPATSEIEW